MKKTQALVPQEHTTVAQSVDVTMSGLGYTKTQRRLLYEVIRNIQPLYKGVDVKKQGGEPLNYSSFVDKVFSIPIKDILSDGNRNYAEIKESLLDMIHKLVLVKDDGKDFYVVNFVDMLHIPEGSGVVRIRMTTSFYKMMANIASGISVYDIDIIKKFPSLYTMNMYEYITRWDDKPPRVIALEELRKMTGVNEVVKDDKTKKEVINRKFPNTGDFEKCVLQVAKEQMEDPQYACAYTFDYERVTKGRKIIAYKITVYKDSKLLTEGEKRYEYKKVHDTVNLELTQPVIQKLKDIGFDYAGIRSNIAMFNACEKKAFGNFLGILSTLHSTIREKQMKKELKTTPQAYVIGALRKMLQARGIEVKADGTVITGMKKQIVEAEPGNERTEKARVKPENSPEPEQRRTTIVKQELTPDLFGAMTDFYANKMVNR